MIKLINPDEIHNQKERIESFGVQVKNYGVYIKGKQGIGSLSEKTMHAFLKDFYSKGQDNQEVPVCDFVADICVGNEIIEVQTRNFDRLREKLNRFLKENKVMVVYPIPATKWVSWIDHETGEISKERKSPKYGNPYMVFPELYKIKNYLKDKNFFLCITMVDTKEFRNLDGYDETKKKRSSRFDRIPVGLEQEILLERKEDYLQFVPSELDKFTVKEFAKETHTSPRLASIVLNILYYMEVIERVDKKGNAYIYQVTQGW